jgi:hypothetical protein
VRGLCVELTSRYSSDQTERISRCHSDTSRSRNRKRSQGQHTVPIDDSKHNEFKFDDKTDLNDDELLFKLSAHSLRSVVSLFVHLSNGATHYITKQRCLRDQPTFALSPSSESNLRSSLLEQDRQGQGQQRGKGRDEERGRDVVLILHQGHNLPHGLETSQRRKSLDERRAWESRSEVFGDEPHEIRDRGDLHLR